MRKLSLLVGLLVVASMILAACTPAPTAEPIYVTQIVEGTPPGGCDHRHPRPR